MGAGFYGGEEGEGHRQGSEFDGGRGGRGTGSMFDGGMMMGGHRDQGFTREAFDGLRGGAWLDVSCH